MHWHSGMFSTGTGARTCVITPIPIEIITEHESFDADAADLFGKVSYKDAIVINGVEANLYPTFDNPSTALSNVKKRCKDVLVDMQEKNRMEDFSASTWHVYYDKIMEMEGLPNSGSDRSSSNRDNIIKQIEELKSFFDIYENNEKNIQIRGHIKQIDSDAAQYIGSQKQITDICNEIEELNLLMPANDKWTAETNELRAALEDNYEDSNVSKAPGNDKFSISKGVTYADQYAVTANVNDYGLASGGDCTNFVSQIKHEGGVPYYLTGNVKKGWSHWFEYHSNYRSNAYSIKWCRANAFIKYYGTKSVYRTAKYQNKRTAFIKFAKAVKKGSFIAYDEQGDGDWDHNAFVSHLFYKNATSRASISYHGSQFLDFKIAQHSRNYNAWVSGHNKSTSGDSGWEDLPYDHKNVVFAIVN